jgi:hypothetical protein
MAKKNELTEEQLAVLNDGFPISEDESSRLSFPRLEMLSKDLTEETGTGKNKKIKVIEAAGTFFTEKDEGETDKDGKKKWTRTYITEAEIEVIIFFFRKQLRKFDSSLNKFISTPIFDSKDQVLPLYLDKQVIKRGTMEELQALYPALTQKGKPTSDLKEETILYVIYEGEKYQMRLSVSGGYNFKTYKRSVNPSSVVTILGSEEGEFGSNTYSKVTFRKDRAINGDEFPLVIEGQNEIKEQVESDEAYYLQNADSRKADEDLDKLAAPSKKGKDF